MKIGRFEMNDEDIPQYVSRQSWANRIKSVTGWKELFLGTNGQQCLLLKKKNRDKERIICFVINASRCDGAWVELFNSHVESRVYRYYRSEVHRWRRDNRANANIIEWAIETNFIVCVSARNTREGTCQI